MMENFDEYIHFVVGAKIAGCEIEECDINDFTSWFEHQDIWEITKEPCWDWVGYLFRIKLPKRWEYVYEDGEIAFRYQRIGEWTLKEIDNKYIPVKIQDNLDLNLTKRPIIKRTGKE